MWQEYFFLAARLCVVAAPCSLTLTAVWKTVTLGLVRGTHSLSLTRASCGYGWHYSALDNSFTVTTNSIMADILLALCYYTD